MAIYRTVSMSFWTDTKIVDDFSPEDRYFYLYLFTNPHTNLSGCYEISLKQMSTETGYKTEKVAVFLKRFRDGLKVIDYDNDTKELLLINWHKYNWTSSEKFRKPLIKEIDGIKNESFKNYLSKVLQGENPRYRIDTKCINTNSMDTTVTVTDTVSDTDNVSESLTVGSEEMKEKKHKYGAYKHVLLSDKDIESLNKNHGEEQTQAAIDYLDAYIEEKGYKSKNHKSTIERWVFDAVKKNGHGDNRASSNITPFNPTEYILQQIREEEAHEQAGNEQDSSVNYSGVP